MFQSGFLGTDAGFITDATLLAEIIFFIAICVGVVAQRKGHYKAHDRIQTPVVILNLILIIFVMVTSFMGQRVISTLPQRPGDIYYLIVAIHAALGLIAEGLAIYAMLAGHNILPRKIGRLKYWMWATFGFWTAALIVGVATYYVWYMRPLPPVAETAVPIVDTAGDPAAPGTPKTVQHLLQNFEFAPAELSVVAGTEIVWLNQDGAPHNITFVDGSIASDNFFQNETFSTTFDEPGIYQIYCSLHGSPDGSGMAVSVTVLEDNVDNAAVVAAVPTANPVPPTPTPAPVVAPPPAALVEAEAAPEQVFVGLLSFFDTFTPGDSVAALLNGISVPDGSATLEAWLTDSATGAVFSLGEITPDESGRVSLQYTDVDGRNLMGLFDGFQITQEPQFDDDPTPGIVLYSGQQAPQALAQIRTSTVASDDAPLAYSLGARNQAEELLRHAEFVQIAFDLLSIADAQRHAEHILNVLEGVDSEHFGDLDVAHGIQNPGDGYGIMAYVTQMQAAAVNASEASDATNAIQVHTSHVVLATDNALDWGAQIREATLQIGATKDVGEIGPYAETIMQFADLLLSGADDNGDGDITPNEGGIFTAYQHTQYMGAIGIFQQ